MTEFQRGLLCRPPIHLVQCRRCKECDLPTFDNSTDYCYYHMLWEKRQEECIICSCVPNLKIAVRLSCCLQRFCAPCLNEWMDIKKVEVTCPYCRAPKEKFFTRGKEEETCLVGGGGINKTV